MSKTSMDEALKQVLRDRIGTLRARRQTSTGRAIAEVSIAFPGAFTNSRYPIEVSLVAAAELEARAEQWLDTVKAAFQELNLPWTRSAATGAQFVLDEAIRADYNELFARVEPLVKGRDTGGYLTNASDRAPGFVRSALELLVYGEEKHRTPLDEQLAAPRYAAVLRAWSKGRSFLDGDSVDHANAAKEAVAAVEQLARLVVNQPTATLGDAIKELRGSHRVRAPLLKGMEEVWGWASSEDGVRHGGETLEQVDPSDARKIIRDAESTLLYLLERDTV